MVRDERSVEDLGNVYLADSWVLAIETDNSHVCFVLDAVLQEGHPRFYWPPKAGEQHAYARLRWCLRGEVWWNDGPHLDQPATDATGEFDYGNIDSWIKEGDVDHLEGSWGTVAIRGAEQSVEYFADT
jgi:hypothetical protein